MTYTGIERSQVLSKGYNYLAIFIIALLFIPSMMCCQEASITNTLASNFNATGQVLEIKTPENWREKYVLIGWKKSNNQTYAQYFFVKSGTQKLDFSTIPSWEGDVTLIGTNDNTLKGKILSKTWKDNINFFLSMNPMTPGSINFDLGYNYGKLPFHLILLILFIISSFICLFLVNKKLVLSFYIGFLVVWSLLDIRQIKNHIDQIKDFQSKSQQLTPFEGFDTFYINCRNELTDKVWTLQALPGVLNSYAKYRLADIEYTPLNKKTGRKADYLITTKPKKKKVLYHNQGVSLVKIKN